MKCFIFLLTLAVLAISSPLVAQSQFDFRSTSSGIWTDSQIWEENEAGIWLKPVDGVYPGERHNRDVNVTVEDGSTVTIGNDQVVHINSLSVLGGKVIVEGMLVIGPASDDLTDAVATESGSQQTTPVLPADNTAPQLLQNIPNPIASQFGYETSITFYLDKQYTSASLAIYDLLGHTVNTVFQESNPAEGWHTVKVRLDHLQSGSYPLVLELPNSILRRMIMVIR